MTATLDRQVDWKNVPTRMITAGGVQFAYRELGTNNPGSQWCSSFTSPPRWTTGTLGLLRVSRRAGA
jgi:hypothetical protein